MEKRATGLLCGLLAFGNMLAAPITQAQDVSFIARRTFAVDGNVTAVATGDLNGDGVPDLAVVTWDAYHGYVSVLLGNGDGSFQNARNLDVGREPRSVAIGDFNGDGVVDLAVANLGSGYVSVHLGNGDGSFRSPRTFAAGSSPFYVAVADFNGDGWPDLVVANDPDSVLVLLGNGDGTFEAPRTFAAGSAPRCVAVGDFNGDGWLDLAVANAGSWPGSQYVSVLLGNGDGSFESPRSLPAGFGHSFLAVGDFNGDGWLDLAVANSVDNNISVHLGHGDGSFESPHFFTAGNTPFLIVVGDFDGDGVPDLVVTNQNGPRGGDDSNITLLLGNGDGSFQAARSIGSSRVASAAAVGDFNGDGAPDLAVGGIIPIVSVLLGNGDGSFPAESNFDAGLGPRSVAIGDFDGDGVLDLAVANVASGNVSVLLGAGDGSFQTARNFDAGEAPRSIAVGDFNGDGVLDLAVANGRSLAGTGSIWVLLGNGDGTFQTAGRYGTNFHWCVAIGDFNGDGVLDLAAVNGGAVPPFTGGNVWVLLGNGDGTFQPAGRFGDTSSHPVSVAVGDFDGDGVADLVVVNSLYENVSVFLGNGDGSFQAPRNFAAGLTPSSVAVGDLNGDGILDLAVANYSIPRGTVSVLLGNGDGTFQARHTFIAGRYSNSVALGDFNQDGVPDLVVANIDSDDVSVLLGNGNGTFQVARNFGVLVRPSFVAVGDFNGDGKPDLAVSTNYASVLINNTLR